MQVVEKTGVPGKKHNLTLQHRTCRSLKYQARPHFLFQIQLKTTAHIADPSVIGFLFVVATGLGHVYYGATNSALKGTWVCDGTGQTLASDTGAGTAGPLFHRSQPNNLDGVQHCTSGEKRTDFLIGDIDCTSARYYLCEKP